MKIPPLNRRGGSAMFLMLGLIALLLAVVAANNSSSHSLMRELNHLDQKQREHWKPGNDARQVTHGNAATHSPAAPPHQ